MLDVVVWGVDYRILHRTGHFIHFPTDGPRSCGDRRFPGYSPTVPSDGRRPRRARWPARRFAGGRSVVIDPVSPIFIVSSTTRTPNHLDACIVSRVSGSRSSLIPSSTSFLPYFSTILSTHCWASLFSPLPTGHTSRTRRRFPAADSASATAAPPTPPSPHTTRPIDSFCSLLRFLCDATAALCRVLTLRFRQRAAKGHTSPRPPDFNIVGRPPHSPLPVHHIHHHAGTHPTLRGHPGGRDSGSPQA